jgi:hypothetical protein
MTTPGQGRASFVSLSAQPSKLASLPEKQSPQLALRVNLLPDEDSNHY